MPYKQWSRRPKSPDLSSKKQNFPKTSEDSDGLEEARDDLMEVPKTEVGFVGYEEIVGGRCGDNSDEELIVTNDEDPEQQHFIDQDSMADGRQSIIPRKRPRTSIGSGFINYSAKKYYDRYKTTEYARRNDFMKYCHVCRKKVVGKLRVLPGDMRMRKVWILRSNLDADRSAELWLKELACEGSHGGEYCETHFAPGSKDLRASEIFPIDRRPLEGRHSVLEDIDFDFNSIPLSCVFCGRQATLDKMIPLIRNRSKRNQWVDALSGSNEDLKVRLQRATKGGVTRFLCDWHMADNSFEINSFGEWRLIKCALPDPNLRECDKLSNRTYLVDKARDHLFWEKELYKKTDFMSRVDNLDDIDLEDMKLKMDNIQENPLNLHLEDNHVEVYHEMTESIYKDEEQIDLGTTMSTIAPVEKKPPKKRVKVTRRVHEQPSTSSAPDPIVEYSDESDAENEAIQKYDVMPYTERFCQVCNATVKVEDSVPSEKRLRCWPFDECRHEKWLEAMEWPPDFEESMRTLWLKRRNENNLTVDGYHFCPIHICQSHLDYRNLAEKMDMWLKLYCVVCDTCLKEPDLLVPMPESHERRVKWAESLLPAIRTTHSQTKKWNWLRERLTRPRPTKYRVCVFHFSRDAFKQSTGGTELTDEALPLSMSYNDLEPTPRGPNAVSKCLMCDDWKKQVDMVELRHPTSAAEKAFLVEAIFGADRLIVRRTVEFLTTVKRPILICRTHFADNVNPFSVIAERRVMYGNMAECLLCSHCEDATAMVPFPLVEDERTRRRWLNAMCREPWVHRYLSNRLAVEGRHYLCASHFHRNALRFIIGLGIWKRNGYVPLLACQNHEERQLVWRLAKDKNAYHPLIIEGIDEEGVTHMDYDRIAAMIGPQKMVQIELELKAMADVYEAEQFIVRDQMVHDEDPTDQNHLAEGEVIIGGEELIEECIVFDDGQIYEETV